MCSVVKSATLQVIQAIYGYIESALLCYELFTKVLVSHGFKINPYDHSLTNITINGKQCTISFMWTEIKSVINTQRLSLILLISFYNLTTSVKEVVRSLTTSVKSVINTQRLSLILLISLGNILEIRHCTG